MSMVELTWPKETQVAAAFGRIRDWLQGHSMELRGISNRHDESDQLVVTLRFDVKADALRFRRGFREATLTRDERPRKTDPEDTRRSAAAD